MAWGSLAVGFELSEDQAGKGNSNGQFLTIFCLTPNLAQPFLQVIYRLSSCDIFLEEGKSWSLVSQPRNAVFTLGGLTLLGVQEEGQLSPGPELGGTGRAQVPSWGQRKTMQLHSLHCSRLSYSRTNGDKPQKA